MTNTTSEAAPAGDPGNDPIVAVMAGLMDRLEQVSSRPEPKVTLSELITLLGDRSYAILLLLLGFLNLLPGPPGYGTALGILILGLSIAMMRGGQVKLWAFIGERRISPKLLGGLLTMMRKMAGLIARISEPRMAYLTGRHATPIIGVVIFLLGIVMLCPIPFTNMLPSWALVALCVGMLNHDGVAIIVGLIVGFLGAVAMVAAVWVTFYLAGMVVDALD